MKLWVQSRKHAALIHVSVHETVGVGPANCIGEDASFGSEERLSGRGVPLFGSVARDQEQVVCAFEHLERVPPARAHPRALIGAYCRECAFDAVVAHDAIGADDERRRRRRGFRRSAQAMHTRAGTAPHRAPELLLLRFLAPRPCRLLLKVWVVDDPRNGHSVHAHSEEVGHRPQVAGGVLARPVERVDVQTHSRRVHGVEVPRPIRRERGPRRLRLWRPDRRRRRRVRRLRVRGAVRRLFSDDAERWEGGAELRDAHLLDRAVSRRLDVRDVRPRAVELAALVDDS
mmetsp:Transcript_11810/g.38795  ORF Transcript_11810/g.38795 Transcript_11810/m.38795 type:complete len:287 (+) Transcript_11810:2260-3120(+)